MTINSVFLILISIPKTIWFNFRFLPAKEAIHLPVAVYWKTRVFHTNRGGIEVKNISPGIVRIGFPYLKYPGLPAVVKIDGRCTFEGKANIQLGCELNVSGELTIGDNFICNQGTKIDCKDKSSFGRDVLIGHCCYFSDDDGHYILVDGQRNEKKMGYHIDDHVWFARDCKILKGTTIAKDSVVGAGAVVNKKFDVPGCVIAGVPAKVAKEGIDWEK